MPLRPAHGDGLTANARAAVLLAEEEARSLGRAYVSDGHLLLGRLREQSGVAAEALTAADVTLDERKRSRATPVRDGVVSVESRIGMGERRTRWNSIDL